MKRLPHRQTSGQPQRRQLPRRPGGREQRKLRVSRGATADPGSLYHDESDGYDGGDEYEAAAMERDRGALRIPVRWINTIIGVFLLPLAVIWTQSFFNIFSQQAVHHTFWATEEFWFFSLGTILWLICFFFLPRPLSLYVFGHELTHAIWVWLMGGRVSKFKVGAEGGYILTDKQNVWISLAPYFYPIYSVAVIILYFIASFFWDVAPHTRWLFLALGFTWSFHISFTLWMIPKGQSDLRYHGTFYSLVIIYLMNLALLSALLILAAPEATFKAFLGELLENARSMATWIVAQADLLHQQWQAARG